LENLLPQIPVYEFVLTFEPADTSRYTHICTCTPTILSRNTRNCPYHYSRPSAHICTCSQTILSTITPGCTYHQDIFPLFDLPPEIILMIIDFLPLESLGVFSRISPSSSFARYAGSRLLYESYSTSCSDYPRRHKMSCCCDPCQDLQKHLCAWSVGRISCAAYLERVDRLLMAVFFVFNVILMTIHWRLILIEEMEAKRSGRAYGYRYKGVDIWWLWRPCHLYYLWRLCFAVHRD